MRTKFKNLLVQYKGGGYDGCYWEWNYFLFDAKGKFHNLKSSGRNGIKSKTEAINKLNIRDRKHFSYDEPYTYKLTSKKAIQAFVSESNNHHVDVIGTLVNCIYGKPLITWECDDCGDTVACESDREREKTDPYPTMFHDDHEYHWETKWCESCYLNHSCGYCGACNEPEENNVDDQGHCKWCSPELKKA